jgi:hypothetical protein
LHFLSFAVVSLREDFHLQDRAHAGRTRPHRPEETVIPSASVARPRRREDKDVSDLIVLMFNMQ